MNSHVILFFFSTIRFFLIELGAANLTPALSTHAAPYRSPRHAPPALTLELGATRPVLLCLPGHLPP